MIFVTKGGMSLYPLFFVDRPWQLWKSKNRRLVIWQGALCPSLVGFTAIIELQRVCGGGICSPKKMRFEKPIKLDVRMVHFLTNMSYFEPNGISSSVVYIIDIVIVFSCMNCTNLTKMPEKNPICFSQNRPLVCQNVFQSSDLCEVKCLTRSQVSPLYIMQASSTYRCLVCDDDMYSSFFFLVKNRAKPHILMKRFKIELIYSSWTKCGVSTRWWINYISIYI